jgi:predicted RNase H-like HicB family nuclease
MTNAVLDSVLTGESVGTLTVVFHACEEGGFTAECLELPGCFSEGETQEEAERNIRDAINGCLSVLFEDCLSGLRARMDLSAVDLKSIARQESFAIETPQLRVPALAS